MNSTFFINDFEVGGNKSFIIAELSANHNGNIQNAINTIKSAKLAGADCIKLQTYTPDTITLNCKKSDFKINGTIWDGQYLHDLYKSAYTPWEWHKELFHVAKQEGLIIFSSPFDHTAVDFLESLNTPAYKIASFEITDIPLIRYVASKQKPIIISTGIATKHDIELAINACRKEHNNKIALLKCTSSYPAPIEDANLATMSCFKQDFNVIPGLSDHTSDIVVPIAATALGAKIIEKHFIINKNIGGPDASFSLEPNEFKLMVEKVRLTEKSLGQNNYPMTEKMIKSKEHSRSIYATKNIKKGELFDKNNIKSIRPGFGLHPKYFEKIISKPSKNNYEIGDRILKNEL